MARQITEEQIEKIVESLVDRVEKANSLFLKQIGSSIKAIKELKPSKAHQLIQMLKYGTKYEDIVAEIQKYTDLNIKDVDEIFKAYAKKDLDFYKQFYEYRNKPFIPFDQNTVLKEQTMALSSMVRNELYNFTRDNVLGYTINGEFFKLRDTYNNILDEAFLQVGQGKNTFDTAMRKILTDIGGSGLRTINYESGRSVRLDSVVRMHLKGRLRELHNENQKIIGEEIKADGVEISVHFNPAPDHEEVQGRQFTTNKYDEDGKLIKKGEFEKLQEFGIAKDTRGVEYNLHAELKNGETSKGFRPISEMNCYHYIFSIVLGVNKPEYSDEQLKQIIKDNDEGFEYEGQHYSNYEGTQLQRRIETEIRKQKDIQILAKASGDDELLYDSESKITMLSKKYKELSQISGLPTKADRLRVEGYIKTKPSVLQRIGKKKDEGMVAPIREKAPKTSQKLDFNEWQEVFDKKDVKIRNDIKVLDKDLLDRNINQLDYLTNKYKVTSNQYLEVGAKKSNRYMGVTYYARNEIGLSTKYFTDKEYLVNTEKRSQATKWHNPVKEENLDLYTLTHEYGHAIEFDYARRYLKRVKDINTEGRRLSYSRIEDNLLKQLDTDIRNDIFDIVRRKENLTVTQIKDKYFSGYGKSKRNYEWFAETFTQLELGEQNVLTEAMKEWMEEHL